MENSMRVFLRSWHSSQHIFFSRVISRVRMRNTATQFSSHTSRAMMLLSCVQQAVPTLVMVLCNGCFWVFDKYLVCEVEGRDRSPSICTAVLRSLNISTSAPVCEYANVSVTRLPDCSHATESLGFW